MQHLMGILRKNIWSIIIAAVFILLGFLATLYRDPYYIINFVFYGFLNGSMYALGSIGFIMGITVSRFVNIFHGELIILGAYIAYWLSIFYSIDALYFTPLSAAVLFLIGVALFMSPFGSLNERAHAEHRIGPAVIIAFGLSVLLQNLMQNLWTIDTRIIPTYGTVYNFLGVIVPESRLTSSLVAITLLVIIWAFLKFTRHGKAIRAISQDPQAAQSVGINTKTLGTICFGLATATGGISGTLLSRVYPFNPFSGFIYLQKMGIVLLLGRLSVIGALIAGVLFGIMESYITCFLGIYYQEMLGGILFIALIAFQQLTRGR